MARLHNPKKTVFKNGLTLITVPIKNSTTVTTEVFVETGSKYETSRQAGLSHFLEHMCFKGTHRRPTSEIIAKELDELGAQYNAYTSTELTAYYVKGKSEHTDKFIDVLADMYLNSVFDKNELEKEKGVILQEINLYQDKPERIASILFNQTAYGDQPAGRPVIGTKETTQSFEPEDFKRYRDSHYVAKATTVVVAGGINHKEVVRSVSKHFSSINKAKRATKNRVNIKRGLSVGVYAKDTDQTHIVFGVRSFPYGHKNNVSLSLISSILSSGFSSRLVLKMREELGICYYVHSTNDPSTDHGDFSISSGVDPKRLNVAISAIADEMRRLASEEVSKKELAKAVEKCTSNMFMGLESSDDVSEYYGHRWLFNRDVKDPKEIERELKSVTPKDIMKVAKEIFKPENVIFSVVGRDIKKDHVLKMVRESIKNW